MTPLINPRWSFWPVALALLLAACDAGAGSYDLDGGDLILAGKAFVERRGCPTCHQSANAADGVLSGQSTPRPGTHVYGANLTPDTATGLGGWADIQILRAMRFGIDSQEMPLCPTMPHYDGRSVPDGSDVQSETFMTDLEAGAIIAYLRSLAPARRSEIPASLCPPLKERPGDLAMPAGDDLGMPVDDLVMTVPDDLKMAPSKDLAARPLEDLSPPADGGARD